MIDSNTKMTDGDYRGKHVEQSQKTEKKKQKKEKKAILFHQHKSTLSGGSVTNLCMLLLKGI